MRIENMDIRAIAAVARNGAIGLNGQLPWPKEKGDLAFFKQQTRGGIIVFGHKTVECSPHLRSLPDRIVHVWEKSHTYHGYDYPDIVAFLHSIMRSFEHMPIKPTIWIAGGESVYRTFAPYCRSICITTVDYHESQADAFFPFDAFFNKKISSKIIQKA